MHGFVDKTLDACVNTFRSAFQIRPNTRADMSSIGRRRCAGDGIGTPRAITCSELNSAAADGAECSLKTSGPKLANTERQDSIKSNYTAAGIAGRDE